MINQSESALQTKRDLLYDPHGSTRALISTNPGTGAPDINNGYFWTYDAYGNAIESSCIGSALGFAARSPEIYCHSLPNALFHFASKLTHGQ